MPAAAAGVGDALATGRESADPKPVLLILGGLAALIAIIGLAVLGDQIILYRYDPRSGLAAFKKASGASGR